VLAKNRTRKKWREPMTGYNVVIVNTSNHPISGPLFVDNKNDDSKIRIAIAGKSIVILSIAGEIASPQIHIPSGIIADKRTNIFDIIHDAYEHFRETTPDQMKELDPHINNSQPIQPGEWERFLEEHPMAPPPPEDPNIPADIPLPQKEKPDTPIEGQGDGPGPGVGWPGGPADSDQDTDRGDTGVDPGGEIGGGACFAGGTDIVMGDGSRNPIEKIRPGDSVLASVGPTGETFPCVVKALLSYVVPSTVKITLSNGEKVETSPRHKVVTVAGPMRAAELRPGARLISPSGITARVDYADVKSSSTAVHNLELDGADHYFVGTLPIRAMKRKF
jgi:hypothetical protein